MPSASLRPKAGPAQPGDDSREEKWSLRPDASNRTVTTPSGVEGSASHHDPANQQHEANRTHHHYGEHTSLALRFACHREGAAWVHGLLLVAGVGVFGIFRGCH